LIREGLAKNKGLLFLRIFLQQKHLQAVTIVRLQNGGTWVRSQPCFAAGFGPFCIAMMLFLKLKMQ
jgi:hypothetical protein